MDVKTTTPCSLENSTAKSSEIAKVLMENSNNMEEAATSSENAKEVKRGINEVLKEMEEEKKTKAASLDTLMADFPGEEKCNALLGGMPLKDFSMLATRLLKHHYKVEDKNIIFTTAYAM